MLLRLILLGVFFYWGFKLIGRFFRMLTGQEQGDSRVKGRPKQDTRLHLNDDDIEDADFEEID